MPEANKTIMNIFPVCAATETEWFPLDNAGKLFPSTNNKYDTKVFRFSAEMTEDVDPEALQRALDETMEYFPHFRSVIKKGLFWYYFEECRIIPIVREEDKPPCSPIFSAEGRNLLFDVTYYRRRINFEAFHSLTDGTGALDFLKMLVCRYVAIKYPESGGCAADYEPSFDRSGRDDFEKYYSAPPVAAKKKKRVTAYRLRGKRNGDYRMSVVEGSCDASAIIAAAHAHDATVTVYLAALLIEKIGRTMSVSAKKKPVVLGVPVNLRNYYDSASTRNFFSMINVSYLFKGGDTFEDIIASVKASFASQLTKEAVADAMNRYAAIEHRLYTRLLPLPVKSAALRIADAFIDRGVTAGFSNLAIIKLPPQAAAYVRRISVLYATEKMHVCFATYGGRMNIAFTSPFTDTGVERGFFRSLNDSEADVEITSNF